MDYNTLNFKKNQIKARKEKKIARTDFLNDGMTSNTCRRNNRVRK